MIKTLILLFAAILSSSVSTVFPVDALLVLIIIYSFILSEMKCFAFSFLSGAANDFAVPGASPLAPCYACLGLAQSVIARFIFRANVFYVLVFVIFATFFKSVYLLAFSGAPLQISGLQNAFPGLMRETLGNILITPVLYFVLLKK